MSGARGRFLGLLFFGVVVCFPVPAQIFDFQEMVNKVGSTSVRFDLDNDAIYSGKGKTDNQYTNGFKLVLSGTLSNNLMNQILQTLVPVSYQDVSNFLEVSQNLYTPTDLTRSDPILDDRPYAAWTRIGFYLNGRRTGPSPIYDSVGFSLGELGDGGGGFTQTFVHKMYNLAHIPTQLPQGWANHVGNRLASYFVYNSIQRIDFPWLERHQNESRTVELNGEIFSHSTTELGNVFTRQTLGFEQKFGLFSPVSMNYDPESSPTWAFDWVLKENILLTAYNGTLDVQTGVAYSIYQIPLSIDLQSGFEAVAPLPCFLLYFRYILVDLQSADFAVNNSYYIMDPYSWFHNIGKLSLSAVWRD